MIKKKERKVFEDPIKILDEEKKSREPQAKAVATEVKTGKTFRKKKTRSPAYLKSLKKINPTKAYHLDEAIKLAKETAYAKFNSSIEAHFQLGIDTDKDEQKVRTNLVLPHGTGKSPVVIAFVPVDRVSAVRGAGADLIGDEEKIEEIGRGLINFDVVVADPSIMIKLSKVAKVLGPRGLMPNPKSGTVTTDAAKVVREIKKGRVEIKSETAAPLLHAVIGKTDFSEEQLRENFLSLLAALIAAKPAKTKGNFIRSLTFSPTMGPGIKVDLDSLPK